MTADDTPKQPTDWRKLDLDAGKVFTPTTPINAESLFAGRRDQIRLIVDAVNQKGQHAVVYGERGVGKTSLANVLSAFLGSQEGAVFAPRVNCDGSDTFDTVWRKLFEEMSLKRTVPTPGFTGGRKDVPVDLLGAPEGTLVTPDIVRRSLTMLSQHGIPILIVDEFDRLSTEPRRAFADAVKMLSDHAVNATVVLVGVADSVDQLIQQHQSVERALVQIQMPRMSHAEVGQIVTTGLGILGMSIEDAALRRIVGLSQGFPHYTHLISLYATRSALDSQSVRVATGDVDKAIEIAVKGAQQSIRTDYETATRSARRDSLFPAVLLACAMAKTDDRGFFAAQDIRLPIQKITGKAYQIPSFAQHLNDFLDKRGKVLEREGQRKSYRYRFRDPLLQPFVIMHGIKEGRIKPSALD